MATATIVLTDEDGETADVKIEFDPALPPGLEPDKLTTAQLLALKMVEAVASQDELDAAKAAE